MPTNMSTIPNQSLESITPAVYLAKNNTRESTKSKHYYHPSVSTVANDSLIEENIKESPSSNDPHGSGKQGNVAVTSFNLMKTIIGAGIFATPYALNNCGFAFGLALIITMGFLFYFTIMTLVHSAVLTNKTSIQELVKHCFGKWGEAILNIMLFLNTWGCMASYTVIIGDVMPNVMRFLMGSPQTEFMSVFLSRRGQINLICFLIIFPISLARSLAHLGKYSGVALAAIVTIFVSVLAVGPMLPGPFKGSEPISIIKGDGIAGAISVFSFAYVCQHNVMLNYAALKNATPARFAKVTRISLTGAVVFTLTIAMAYLTFREKSKDNILNSFPDSNSVIAVARLLFGMDMMFTLPLELFIARDTVEKAFFKNRPFSNIRHIVITLLILISTTLVANVSCNLGIILEITGGVAATFLAFMVPCACWLRSNQLAGQQLNVWAKVKHGAVIGFGVVVMIVTLVTVAIDTVNKSSGHDEGSADKCNW